MTRELLPQGRGCLFRYAMSYVKCMGRILPCVEWMLGHTMLLNATKTRLPEMPAWAAAVSQVGAPCGMVGAGYNLHGRESLRKLR